MQASGVAMVHVDGDEQAAGLAGCELSHTSAWSVEGSPLTWGFTKIGGPKIDPQTVGFPYNKPIRYP